jgi:outer membrane protein assembly factor BamB
MATKDIDRWIKLAPVGLAVLGLVALIVWQKRDVGADLKLRVPGTDQAAGDGGGVSATNPVLRGTLVRSDGKPASLPGSWPQLRGPNRDGISREPVTLLREWPPTGPRHLWSVEVGEGYAGAAVANGCVYLMDYDRAKRQDALRCLSLADGREIWRFAYPVPVKRNHGMSRTVPTVASNVVVAMGPKCHVVALNPVTGELKWGLDLVRQFGAKVPDWYAGQCPLIEGDRVILAPGGSNVLMMAVEAETGRVLWQTPNPREWKMTHSSIMPMDFQGQHLYVYCGSRGVVGVSARDGAILWDTTDWKISIATVPSPVILDDGRIFLSGGYNAGSLMLQLKDEGGKITAQTLYRLKPEVFGATQQTPILHQDHLYGVRPDGEFVCLDLQGKSVWSSGSKTRFGLGPFLLSEGLIFAANDTAQLTLLEATPSGFHALAQAQVIQGQESWGPLTLAGGRLLMRDLTRLVCLEVVSVH